MKDPSKYAAEREIASEVLLQTSAIVTPLLSTFSAWLMAGLGAAFTLLVANIDSITKYVPAHNFRWALLWFSASLLAGLAARFFRSLFPQALPPTPCSPSDYPKLFWPLPRSRCPPSSASTSAACSCRTNAWQKVPSPKCSVGILWPVNA